MVLGHLSILVLVLIFSFELEDLSLDNSVYLGKPMLQICNKAAMRKLDASYLDSELVTNAHTKQ